MLPAFLFIIPNLEVIEFLASANCRMKFSISCNSSRLSLAPTAVNLVIFTAFSIVLTKFLEVAAIS